MLRIYVHLEFKSKSWSPVPIGIGLHLVRMEVVKNSAKCKPISPTCSHVPNFHSTVAFSAWPRPFCRKKKLTGINNRFSYQTLKDVLSSAGWGTKEVENVLLTHGWESEYKCTGFSGHVACVRFSFCFAICHCLTCPTHEVFLECIKLK